MSGRRHGVVEVEVPGDLETAKRKGPVHARPAQSNQWTTLCGINTRTWARLRSNAPLLAEVDCVDCLIHLR